jgi:hypothetical protein
MAQFDRANGRSLLPTSVLQPCLRVRRLLLGRPKRHYDVKHTHVMACDPPWFAGRATRGVRRDAIAPLDSVYWLTK